MVKRRKIDHQSGSDTPPAPPQSAAAALRARRQQQNKDDSDSAREASAGNTPVPNSNLEVPRRPKRRSKPKPSAVPDKDAATPSSTKPRREALEQQDAVPSATDVKPVSAVEARRRALKATAQPISDLTTEVSDGSSDDFEPDYLARPSDADDSNFPTSADAQSSDAIQNALYPPPIVELSSWTPQRGTVIKNNASGMTARLESGETLANIGVYDMFVKRGVVEIYGAILRAGPNAQSYRVFAPASHALPVIQCLSPDGAEVELKSVDCAITPLERLSPLYARLWKSENSPDPSFLKKHKKRWSFENIHRLSDDALCRPLYHLEIPQKWHQAIDKICSAASKSGPGVYERILVCGPKNTGKSTFARLLLNRMFTIDREAMKREEHSIFLLDIDPGQPEYSPPGQISLIELRQPIFGPPYSHPSASTGSHQRTIRSHFIGAKSPRDNPEHFIECVVDLMTHYQKHLTFGNTHGPIVINSPGWIIGTGLQILTTLIDRLSLTDVTYTTDEPSRSHDALRAAAAASVPRFQAIPLQPSGTAPTRTAADFRDMQTLSYFHLAAPRQGSPAQSWDASPLTAHKPYVLSYAAGAEEEGGAETAASSRDFLAVMPLGEALPPSTLATVLNGAIIGIVALSSTTTAATTTPIDLDATTTIVRTPTENIPFLSPTTTASNGDTRHGHIEPLPPQSSHLVCLALVRGIDTARQALHVLVPAACEHLVAELAPERTLLVLGTGVDTPGWAYLEELHAAEAKKRREARKERVSAVAAVKDESGEEGEEEEEGEEVDVDVVERPWVQRMEGGGGGEGEVTGAMGKKRRLRRFVN